MKRRGSSGAYSITSAGVDTSAPTLGAAISKALTYANRIHLARGKDDDVQSLYIRRIGDGRTHARIDVRADAIEAYVLVQPR